MPRPSYLAISLAGILFLTLFHLSRRTISSASASTSTDYFSINHWKGASRLAMTLASNEERYQEAVRNRYILLEKLGGAENIPACLFFVLLLLFITPLFLSFPTPASHTVWDYFVPAFSCPFPVYRVGTLGDGGKWVCGLERAMSKPKCVVYSMGVERQSSFEEHILSQYKHCEVFGFDYSVDNWGPELRARPEILDRAHFNKYKMSKVDNHHANPKEYSMQGIMAEKGHTFIDILKMDIEGWEFDTLSALIGSFDGAPLPFGQLQLEIHITVTGITKVAEFEKWWSVLEKAGLRPFWTEPNLVYVNNVRGVPDISEWSFMNIRGMHPLLDDTLPETLI